MALAIATRAGTPCNVEMGIGPGVQVGTGKGAGSHRSALVGMWTPVVVLGRDFVRVA